MRDSRRGIRTRSLDAGQHLGFDGGFLSGQELQKPLGSHDLGIWKLLDEVAKLLFLTHLNLCPEASPSMLARRGVASEPNRTLDAFRCSKFPPPIPNSRRSSTVRPPFPANRLQNLGKAP